MDLDRFSISLERPVDSSLLENTIINEGISDTEIVASFSYEDQKYGLQSSMLYRMTKQLCSQAIFRRFDIDQYYYVFYL